MDAMFEWKIAFRNLFRNKRRTTATVSALVTGFCGLCLLGGYILRTEKYLKVSTIYNNHLGHFSIYTPKGVDYFYINPKKYQLKGETLIQINDILKSDDFNDRIDFVGQYISGMGLISSGKNSLPFIAKGIEPEIASRIKYHPLVRAWIKELGMQEQGIDLLNSVKNNPESISVTANLGELLGLRLPFTQEISKREVQLAGRTIYGDLNAVNAVITLSHSTGMSLAEDTGLIAPIELLKELYGLEGISHMAVYLQKGASVSATVKELIARFKEKNIIAEVIPFYDERIGQFYTGNMDFLYIMGFFFVFLICSAVAISIVNAMTMGILERAREIGTMRSLGLSEKIIVSLFVKEAIIMTIFGIVVGTILTQLISSTVNSLDIYFSPPGIAGSMRFILTPDFWLCAVAGALMLFVSGLTGYFVTKKKANLKIVTLLTDAGR